MCRCVERRETIKEAARGNIPIREAATHVITTLTEDATEKVMNRLNQRFNRRAA